MNERIVIQKPGGLDALQVVQEAEPVPQPGQVKVRILASGVAFGDVLLRRGLGARASAFPVTPGYDFVGVVEALGAGSTQYAVGDQVAGFPVTGGYQHFIRVAEAELIPVPSGLSPNDAVSVILNYTTAYQLLTRVVQLAPGAAALMHGAAGGVGSAMLQLAHLRGVKMYGTVSSGKMDSVRQLGATPIDYTRTDFVKELHTLAPNGVQAVFDPVGGRQLTRSYQVVAKGGTLVMFGAASAIQGNSNQQLALIATVLRVLALKLRPDGKHVAVYSIPTAKKKNPAAFRQDVQTLLGLLQDGKITPQIAMVLPLRDARHAHELLETRQVTGKIILQP